MKPSLKLFAEFPEIHIYAYPVILWHEESNPLGAHYLAYATAQPEKAHAVIQFVCEGGQPLTAQPPRLEIAPPLESHPLNEFGLQRQRVHIYENSPDLGPDEAFHFIIPFSIWTIEVRCVSYYVFPIEVGALSTPTALINVLHGTPI
jgi:hypothetical protein